MRTVVNCVWNSHNAELLEIIFNKSNRTRKPTNKEFFKYMYDYVIQTGSEIKMPQTIFSCPLPYLQQLLRGALSAFYVKLSKMYE